MRCTKSFKKIQTNWIPVLSTTVILDMTFFGFKTLERSYLLKLNGQIVERPQHMLMRVFGGHSSQ